MPSLDRTIQVSAAAASIAVAVGAAAALRTDHLVAGVLLVAALAWAAVPPTVDALIDRRRSDANATDHRLAGFTSIVRVGDEPAEVARTGIVLSAAAGPTIVATTRRDDLTEVLSALGVPICVASDMESAVRDAAALVETPAALVLSASAFPRADACRRAAALLDDRVGWVVGLSQPFNDDGYAPEGRELLGAAERARARRIGLDLWEREAVIVRTDLLRADPLEPRRPWGAFLRRQQRAGFVGAEHPAPLTRRASPVGAESYWSATIARKRGTAADLGDALRTTRGLPRLTAAALLMRELHAYPLLVWLAAPVLIHATGAFPFRWPPGTFSAAVGTAAVLRYVAARRAAGVPLRPASDALAVAYDTPGSLLALSAAVTRTVRPTRVRIPDRPLVWFELLLTLLLALPLVGRTHQSPTSAVAGALVLFAIVWVLAMRALLQRLWERAAYRFVVDLPVSVNGIAATAVDASPSGMGVVGDLAHVPLGERVELTITLPDDSPLAVTGTVIDRRHRDGREVVGLAVDMRSEDQIRWLPELFRQAASVAPQHTAPELRVAPSRAVRLVRAGERALLALVGGAAVFAIGALLLVLVGYRPLVVRSESMVPTLRIGDLVIVQDVSAHALQVDDIVTFPDPEGRGDTVTHRVRAITQDGYILHFETQGDANESSEYWSAAADEVLGRYTWRIPAIGRALVALSQPTTRFVLGSLAVAALAATAFDALVLRRRTPSASAATQAR